MRPAARLFLFRLRRELRRGVLPIRVLEELSVGPAYGYELMRRLGGGSAGPAAIGASSLYPALARLKAAGLVRSFHGATSFGPLRKYYALTAAGRAILPALAQLSSERAVSPRAALGAP